MKLHVIGSSSKGNAYALESTNEILLIEAGCRIQEVKKAIGWHVEKIVGCVVTHLHKDHIGKIKDYFGLGFPILTNGETAEYVEAVCMNKVLVLGAKEHQLRFLGKFSVSGFYLPHNGVANFGYLIHHPKMGYLVFMTDMEYCKFDFSELRPNHLLIEANYDMNLVDRSIPNYEHKLLGHSSIQTTCGIIQANRTTELMNVVLCHLGAFSDEVDFVRQAREAAGPGVSVDVANAGKVFELGLEPF